MLFNKKNVLLASIALMISMHPNPSSCAMTNDNNTTKYPNVTTNGAIVSGGSIVSEQITFLTEPVKYKTRFVSASTLNVRVRPNTKSKKLGTLNFNAKIKVVKTVKCGTWLKITYKGKTAYVCKKYTSKKKCRYKEYVSPSSNGFKSYESGSCITNNTRIAQGSLKKQWKLDTETGVYMVGDRYCVAVGSYYTKKIGTKLDLVLKNNGKTHVLKCILADGKADKDTVNNHRVHKDGSVAEFVVNTSYLPRKAKQMGDVSYASNKFAGSISKIRIYK